MTSVTLYIKDVVSAIEQELEDGYNERLIDILMLCAFSATKTLQVSIEDFNLFRHSVGKSE